MSNLTPRVRGHNIVSVEILPELFIGFVCTTFRFISADGDEMEVSVFSNAPLVIAPLPQQEVPSAQQGWPA